MTSTAKVAAGRDFLEHRLAGTVFSVAEGARLENKSHSQSSPG